MITSIVRTDSFQAKVQSTKKTQSFRNELLAKFNDRLIVNPDLTRSLVSFQANKVQSFYRWFKYKEAFSHDLINYILDKFETDSPNKTILDPFSGVGTTLTTAAKKGYRSVGIELLPVGIAALNARLSSTIINKTQLTKEIDRLKHFDLQNNDVSEEYFFKHLNITKKAFSRSNEMQLANYRKFVKSISNKNIRKIFDFAAMSSLEEISYTRKDGQYLRWDSRSNRKLKSSFNKGKIHSFKDAIFSKLEMILSDLESSIVTDGEEKIQIINGSCLEQMVLFNDESFDVILTSPPYCNRYDYTRTYALELAFLGLDEIKIKDLRQTLLSATVENKSKRNDLRSFYKSEGKEDIFNRAESIFEDQHALKEIIDHLKASREELNNKNIPDMVENYFFEMCILITEMARTLKLGGRVAMVNDNVQYHGEEIPVDLILSNIAEDAGLTVENIWVLGRGKGNSSQQMDEHGRRELRKCIYVWRK